MLRTKINHYTIERIQCSLDTSFATSMALAAYRHVLRSARIAFQGTCPHAPTLYTTYASEDLTRSSVTDDAWMLSAARVEARSKFDNNRSLPVESVDTQQKINEAEEVARILRQNIVQGQKVEGTGVGDKRYRTYDLPTKTLVR